jgi:hypothetical protein
MIVVVDTIDAVAAAYLTLKLPPLSSWSSILIAHIDDAQKETVVVRKEDS